MKKRMEIDIVFYLTLYLVHYVLHFDDIDHLTLMLVLLTLTVYIAIEFSLLCVLFLEWEKIWTFS